MKKHTIYGGDALERAEKAVEIISMGDDRVMPDHFDPDVLQACSETHDEFRRIALQYADHEEERKVLLEQTA